MGSSKHEDFPYPSSWNDDVRMDSLFAPFKQRVVNPNNYDSKMSFWSSLIEQWCLHHKAPVVDVSALCQQFRRKDKTPHCLGEVIEYLQKNKTLISKEAFEQMLEQSWTKWALQVFIANPLRWTLNTVKNKFINISGCSDSALLHLPVIKKLGEETIQSVPEDQKGKLLDVYDLQEMCSIKNMDFLEIILNHLCSMKLVAMHKCQSKLFVKFPKRENKNLTITDVDKAFLSLEQNAKMLGKNLERLEGRRQNFIAAARMHVSAKNTNQAKASLRRAKIVEKMILKMSDCLENIENLMYQMEMAEVDNAVLECYQTGVRTLKNYFKDSGLNKEKVENVRGELEEMLTFKMDIDEMISTSLDRDVTDEELEEDLKNLLDEEKPAEDGDLLKLPDVPFNDPLDEVADKLEKSLASLAI